MQLSAKTLPFFLPIILSSVCITPASNLRTECTLDRVYRAWILSLWPATHFRHFFGGKRFRQRCWRSQHHLRRPPFQRRFMSRKVPVYAYQKVLSNLMSMTESEKITGHFTYKLLEFRIFKSMRTEWNLLQTHCLVSCSTEKIPW